MICKACGATIPDESEFCNKCGQRTAEVGEEEQPQTPVEKLAAKQDTEDQASAEKKEQDLWEGRLSWKAYGVWFLLLAVLGVIFLVFFIVKCIQRSQSLRLIGYGELIVWFALFGWLLFTVLKYKLTLKYRVTTQRLFIERGLISKTIDEVELIRVDDVIVKQNIIQRMFDVGNVVAITPTDATNTEQALLGIENPIEVKEYIRENARKLREKGLHIEQL